MQYGDSLRESPDVTDTGQFRRNGKVRFPRCERALTVVRTELGRAWRFVTGYGQTAASSPSRRNVRHLALPPALMNSPSSVQWGVKPSCWRSASRREQPVLTTT